ncbi:MAG TPA: YcxB family protein [Chitinophagaceae bacterium]|nr:YcxB family protein [Chitinophagaceae bacterium]
MIKIKSKISFKQYRKLLFSLAYKKPMMKFLLCIAFAMVVWIAGYYLHLLPVPRPQIYQYITLVLITVVQPLVIYFTIKQNYYSSNHLGEQLEIQLTPGEIKMHGQSFYTEITWKKIYKIDELTNWFLIYQNSLSAIIIPKASFHGSQLQEFKKILRDIKNVPVHLKG